VEQVMRRPIVVVEDDEALGAVIAETLSDAGYTAVIFTSPERALRFFETEEAALVLTDLSLGAMDGWEFIERMRQRFGDEPPIIVMTGSAIDAQTLRPPARALLSKPFELSALVDMAARWATSSPGA
jgi:CheY-like chemotaxis protein